VLMDHPVGEAKTTRIPASIVSLGELLRHGINTCDTPS
jgi:hypothetical protein